MNTDTVPASVDGQVQDLPLRQRGGLINILIVDDEPKNLTVLETILDNPSYRLIRAETADQALLALVDDEFALLILDIQMPDMNGFELAQMIKQRKKTAKVPIIFLTAYYNEDQHVLEGYGTGAVDYLHKPISPTILRSKVAVFADLHNKNRNLHSEVIERRRAEEQLRELNETLEQRVTERTEALMRTRIALNETDEQYRSLFDGSLDAIFFLGADGRFKAANPAALRLCTRTLEELKTIPFLDLCAPDQREVVGKAFHTVFRRQSFAIDTSVVTITGECRDLFISGAPEIQDGEVVGISCIARDITERIKSEEELRFSEVRYRELIQALPAAVYTTDERGRITLYNQAAVTLWGREPEVGKDLWCGSWKIYRPDGSPLPLDQYPMAVTLREGRAVRGEEIVIERPDGTRRHVLPHPEPTRNAQGVVIGGINMLIDITEGKEAEVALRESEARFRAIADAAPVLIWISGVDKQCIYFNKGWLDFTGRTMEQELGAGWAEGVFSEDFDLCLKTYVDAFDKRRPFEMEYRLRRFDDQYRWVLDHGIPRLGQDGVFLGYIGTCIDITELKQAKEAVQESEQRLGGIISSAMDAIITVDEMQRVTDFNNAAELMFGYAAAAALGQPIDHFIPERFRAAHALHIQAFGHTQVTKRQMGALGTIYGRRADGNEFPIEASISQLRTREGKFYTVILRDITDRMKHEEALRERDRILTKVNDALKKQAMALAEANKELEGFSYSVSHDLRAPLRTIDAFSRILEEDHGSHMNESARRSLAIIRKAVGQAGELIDDLLGFSKLGRQGMTVQTVNMADVVREVVNELRMHEDRPIELTIGDLPHCQGDSRFLKLVWINLLTNALKYTKHRIESRIEIGWMPDDASSEMVIYYVKDNGIGFDMKYVHKLFGVFQRLHRQEDFEGTGVGLAVVQRIVQRHDGRVWAEGKVDGGATFFVSLRKATA
jgi:PAS domain S-box-containing protein